MRVLYFSESYCGHDHRFVTTVASAGHEVYYARLYNTPVDISALTGVKGVRSVDLQGIDKHISFLQFADYAVRFKKMVKEIKPDVIHAGPVDKCASIAAFVGCVPLVAMSWGYDLMRTVERSWVWDQLARYALRKAEMFTSDALATKQKALTMGAEQDRCTTFPWGVDLQHFSQTSRELGREKKLIFFCNRSWEPNYGVDVLAKAFSIAAGKNDDLRLMLLGSGSMEAEIKHIFEKAGCMNKVEFAGRIPQDELPKYYHRADVYITPSHVDGTSVSLMEAMACGLPIIASDIPGNVDWVHEGTHGTLFKDDDVEGLAEKMLKMGADRTALAQMGENCRTTAETRADWEKNKRVLFETYTKAIEVFRTK